MSKNRVLRLSQPASSPTTLPAFIGLVAAQPVSLDGRSGAVTLRFGGAEITAKLLPAVDSIVVRRAIQRGEVVIAQQNPDGWVVVGVLRTSATPGIDVGDDYVIEARRLRLDAHQEFRVVSGAAELVLHAFGTFSLVAKEVTARAKGALKLIGLPLKLN